MQPGRQTRKRPGRLGDRRTAPGIRHPLLTVKPNLVTTDKGLDLDVPAASLAWYP